MSRITSLIPVILLFMIVGVVAYVGYQVCETLRQTVLVPFHVQ